MGKYEIWNKMRKDDTEVYGEPIFDMFLKMTDNLLVDHWRQLDEDAKCSIGPGAVYGVLRDSLSEENDPEGEGEMFREVFNSICKDALNRLHSDHIFNLVNLMTDHKMFMDLKMLGSLIERLDTDEAESILCRTARITRHQDYAREMARLFARQIASLKADRIVFLIVECGVDPEWLDKSLLRKLGVHEVAIILSKGHPHNVIYGTEWPRLIAIARRFRAAGVQAIWRLDKDALKRTLRRKVAPDLKSRVTPDPEVYEDSLYEKIMAEIGEPGNQT